MFLVFFLSYSLKILLVTLLLQCKYVHCYRTLITAKINVKIIILQKSTLKKNSTSIKRKKLIKALLQNSFFHIFAVCIYNSPQMSGTTANKPISLLCATVCADRISLTLVHLCLSVFSAVHLSLCAAVQPLVLWAHWDTWCTCVKQMTPMPVWISPRCRWCMDHVVQSARGHITTTVLGSPLNVALSCTEWRNGSPPRHSVGGARRKCSRPTPCRWNQVLSVWMGTPPSISPPLSFLPTIKPALAKTAALVPTTSHISKNVKNKLLLLLYTIQHMK